MNGVEILIATFLAGTITGACGFLSLMAWVASSSDKERREAEEFEDLFKVGQTPPGPGGTTGD